MEYQCPLWDKNIEKERVGRGERKEGGRRRVTMSERKIKRERQEFRDEGKLRERGREFWHIGLNLLFFNTNNTNRINISTLFKHCVLPYSGIVLSQSIHIILRKFQWSGAPAETSLSYFSCRKGTHLWMKKLRMILQCWWNFQSVRKC